MTVIVKDPQLKVVMIIAFLHSTVDIIGSDNEDESTSSDNESHEVNRDTSNGGGNKGKENGDDDTPPSTTPAQGV